MNFTNATNKSKYVRRKTQVAMWERLGEHNFWYEVKELYKYGLQYWGLDNMEDITATDWETRNKAP